MTPSPSAVPEIHELIELRNSVNWSLCKMFELIVEFDTREAWRAAGSKSTADWIVNRFGESQRTAHEWVPVARAFDRLPAMSSAFREGLLSYEKVCEFTRGAIFGPTPVEAGCSEARSSVEAEARATATRAVGTGRRQGRVSDPEIRIAVETSAMTAAIKHYEDAGWSVADVSRHKSHDLECTKGEKTVHVEVKGTQSKGDVVHLTANEVAHAETNADCALYILAEVSVDSRVVPPVVTGGRPIVFDPWDIAEGELRAVSYEFRPMR